MLNINDQKFLPNGLFFSCFKLFNKLFVVDLIINHTDFEPRSQSYSLSSFRYCVIFFDSCKTVCYCSFAIDILLDLLGEKRLRCEEIRAVTNLEILQLLKYCMINV